MAQRSCSAQEPEIRGSVVLACGFSCPVAGGILVSHLSALADGFLTSGPPGKSSSVRGY